jgi:hypothetical protein
MGPWANHPSPYLSITYPKYPTMDTRAISPWVGNIDTSSLSNFDARNSTVNGTFFVSGGSRLRVRDSVTGSFSVICFYPVVSQGAVQCGDSFP